MLGHSNNKWHLGFYGFLNGRRRLMRCDVDTGGIWLELLYRLRWCQYLIQFSALRIKGGDCLSLTFRTLGKTGRPRCSPVRPGVTPPTMLVPHSMDSLAFEVA